MKVFQDGHLVLKSLPHNLLTYDSTLTPEEQQFLNNIKVVGNSTQQILYSLYYSDDPNNNLRLRTKQEKQPALSSPSS